MALHVPPVANETDAIVAFLAQAQDAFRVLLHGLTPGQASLTPSASSLSVGGLVKHVTAVQRGWLASAEAAARVLSSGCQFQGKSSAIRRAGVVGDAGEHVGEVVLRVETVELGALDQGVDRSGAAASVIVNHSPFFSAERQA